MGALDAIHKCSVGSADFQLEDYELSQKKRVKSGVGAIGLDVEITGTGWIEAADAAAFATKLGTTRSALRVSGQDFRIHGLGEQLIYELLASNCNEGGPHVSFRELPGLDGGPGLTRRYQFTVQANVGGDFGGAEVPSLYQQRVQTRPDGLRVVTRSGTITRSGATAHFTGTILPAFIAVHGPPGWIVSHDYTVDEADRVLTYSIAATELKNPPLPAGTGGAVSVDGEGTYRLDRDEHNRVRDVYEFDLLVAGGDYTSVVTAARPTGVTILRESVSVTLHRETRLRLIFEVLRGTSGTDHLIFWEQSVETMPGGNVWQEKRYSGTDPLLVQGERARKLIVQSGRAVGAGHAPKPPTPLFGDDFVEMPRVTYRQMDLVQWETTWLYVMSPEDYSVASMLGAIQRPSAPQFEN